MKCTRIPVVLLALTLISAAALAQPNLLVCSESGSAAAYLKVCISREGNIVNLESPKTREHIDAGQPLEGYRACWWKPSAAGSPSGTMEIRSAVDPDPFFQDWAPAYRIDQPNGPNTFPLSIYRRTLDGSLQVKQDFARDSAERDLTITMTVTNTSGSQLQQVGLERLVSLHIDGITGDSDYVASARSVLAYNPPAVNGGVASNAVALTGLTTGTSLTVGKFLGYSPLEQCGSIVLSASQPLQVQKADAVYCPDCYFAGYGIGNLAAGASKTVKFLYRAY